MCDAIKRALEVAVGHATTIQELGDGLISVICGKIQFDRLNIGLVDERLRLFEDAYVYGANVAGRQQGNVRTLDGTVVEAAIEAKDGCHFGSTEKQAWIERFPNFGPVFESGMRAMLAVPVTSHDRTVAALVLASSDAQAYDAGSLAIAQAAAQALQQSIPILFRAGGTTA